MAAGIEHQADDVVLAMFAETVTSDDPPYLNMGFESFEACMNAFIEELARRGYVIGFDGERVLVFRPVVKSADRGAMQA